MSEEVCPSREADEVEHDPGLVEVGFKRRYLEQKALNEAILVRFCFLFPLWVLICFPKVEISTLKADLGAVAVERDELRAVKEDFVAIKSERDELKMKVIELEEVAKKVPDVRRLEKENASMRERMDVIEAEVAGGNDRNVIWFQKYCDIKQTLESWQQKVKDLEGGAKAFEHRWETHTTAKAVEVSQANWRQAEDRADYFKRLLVKNNIPHNDDRDEFRSSKRGRV